MSQGPHCTQQLVIAMQTRGVGVGGPDSIFRILNPWLLEVLLRERP